MKKDVRALIIRVDGKVYDAFPLPDGEPSTTIQARIVCDEISNEAELALKKSGWSVNCCSADMDYLYIEAEAYHLEGTYANVVIAIEDAVLEIKQ